MADRREAAQKAWATRQAKARAAANPPVLLQAFLTSNEAIDQNHEIVTSTHWCIKSLRNKATVEAYRNFMVGGWAVERHALHEEIINRLLTGKLRKKPPTLCLVIGGVGTGKSTLIESRLAPELPGAVVIDADKLWLEIPEYQALAVADRRMAADRTYAEVRILRDEILAEAAARRLDIILEDGDGGDNLQEVVSFMIQAGYETSVVAVDCPVEEALKRIQYRANHNPTPEDNLWDSMPRIDLPDKFDYQCVDFAALCCEYEKRKGVNHFLATRISGEKAR